MKKTMTIMLFVLAAALMFTACGPKSDAPKAGGASAMDMLNMLPADVLGVMFIDFNKAMSIESADKAIKESDDYQKYQEFIEKTGIDPQKDIYYIAVGIKGGGTENAAVIANLKYDQAKLMEVIHEESEKEIGEQEYGGMTIYEMEGEDQEGGFCFLDDSNILAGSIAEVKAVIDVLQNKADNFSKNKELNALIDKTNQKALFWGAMLVPDEAKGKVSENPMLSSLKDVSAVSMFFDYKNQNIIAEIKAMSPDAEKNKQIAEMLNGLKAFGSMAANEKPEIGELVNKIQVVSESDHVKISAEIPEELLKSMKDTMSIKPSVDK